MYIKVDPSIERECSRKATLVALAGGVVLFVAFTAMIYHGLKQSEPTEEHPIVEMSKADDCIAVVIGVNKNGQEVRVPCEGKWENAHLRSEFRKRSVAPLWLRQELAHRD